MTSTDQQSPLEYSRIKREVVQALCGSRPAADISRELGYSFNQVKRWLDGTKDLRWSEFYELATATGIDVESALSEMFAQQIPKSGAPPNVIKFLRGYFPTETIEGLAARLHCHPSVLKRYLTGETNPDMEFVFRFLDLGRNYLATFIGHFVKVVDHPDLRALIERDFARIWIESRHPIASAIESCLPIKAYKDLDEHSDEFIAERVGSTAAEVNRLLKLLCEYGNVRKEYGKYVLNYDTINFTGSDIRLACPIVRFWTDRAADRFTGIRPINRSGVPGFVSYRIAPVSPQALTRINETLASCAQQINDILVSDEGSDHEHVRVILMHSLAPNDIPDSTEV